MTDSIPIAVVMSCALALLGGGAARAAAATDQRPVRPLVSPMPFGNERLSDEERLTRFANAVQRLPLHARPTKSSRTVGRLRYQTEDGPLEVYLVLESRLDARGRLWLRVRLPMRPNGRTGWVVRDALGELRAVTTKLRVNRKTLRATLYRGGKRIWSSRIGVGTPSTPTPAGRFWIRERLRNLGGGTVYGPWAFGTAAYSVLSDWPGGGVIGIHGTNQPRLIPGRPSHGCIRVPNNKISQLARLMPIGTPVEIL
ncbi:MAG TPA: L,D-transpeptidase [Solirubrobacteraceae bacterium]|nr:L,D-transpeptidase [Solirubrobacteraceae bacterium]